MNPEQIEQLLRLVRDYGDCLCVSMHPDRINTPEQGFWGDRAEVVFERIETALKGTDNDAGAD